MLWSVDLASGEPVYLQLARAVRQSITSRECGPGSRLPAANAVADDLGINAHTVRRAYGVLRDEGLLEMRRGRGVVVVGASRVPPAVKRLAEKLAAEASGAGLTKEQAARLVHEVWA